jgi:hypothetical protein
MTPEQKLELFETFLKHMADVNDGDVQTLLKANQEAAGILRLANNRKWQVVVETDGTGEDITRWLEAVTDFRVLSVCPTESIT